MMVQWFNGTHLVRVSKDATRPLGVKVETAMADEAGEMVGEWEGYKPSQSSYYRDTAAILVEGMLHLGA